MHRVAVLALLAGPAFAQTVEVTRVEGLNALSTVAQRHLVRVHPLGAGPSLMLAVQRDGQSSPEPPGLHWYRSDDDGRSWRHYARISDDPLHLTADVVVVGADLAVVSSYDTTQTNFTQDAQDPLRRVYFQWWRYDGAGEWEAAPRLTVASPSSGRAYHRANLARDSRGRLWIQAWYRGACPASAGTHCEDTARLWVSSDEGESFQRMPDLTTLDRIGGGRLISFAGKLMALWGDYAWDHQARYALRDDDDPVEQWDAPAVAFSDGDAIYHGAAFNSVEDGRGGLHLVYKDRREQLYYRRFDGSRFSERSFVDGEPHWAVQPALTRHGDELYVCTNHYASSTGSFELQSRKLSDGFGQRVVLESTRDGKFYPTAPETVPPEVDTIPCAFATGDHPGRLKVSLRVVTTTSPPADPGSDGTVAVAFQDGVAPPGFSGTRDTTLLSTDPVRARGSQLSGEADGSADSAFLVAWDVSAVPRGSTVVSARVRLEVVNPSPGSYELYAVKRPWDEPAATWQDARSGDAWEVAGAQGAADRDPTVVGTLQAPSTGVHTVNLTPAGVAMVQRWVDHPESNFGVILQDYVGSSDGVDLSTRETQTVTTRRPRLELTYAPGGSPALPVLTVSATDASAAELGVDPGAVTFGRSGPTDAALTVGYTLLGTATASSDYAPLPGTVQFPAGAAAATVTVTPVEDAEVEGAETVVISLLEGAGYTLGGARSATVTLFDDEVPPVGPVTVSFQKGVAPISAYLGARDASILSGSASGNFGEARSLAVDGSPDQSVLLAWDVSTIPPGSMVEAASITLRIQNPSAHVYAAFALKRRWTEGEVTWTRFDAEQPWQTPGARGPGDREVEVLGLFGAVAVGEATFPLTAAGVALIQRWIVDPASNHGLILQETPNASDGLDFVSSQGEAADRPRLTIRYRPPP